MIAEISLAKAERQRIAPLTCIAYFETRIPYPVSRTSQPSYTQFSSRISPLILTMISFTGTLRVA